MSYNTEDVYVMGQIEHIRNSTGMYVGSTETATRLVEELLDNALDEVQAGHCDFISVSINNKKGIVSVMDNGRGIPFDESFPIEEDVPVMISTRLFSSGKFEKGSGSAYQIASGLHGVGLVAVNALSDKMEIEIYRNGLHGVYIFKDAVGDIKRFVTKPEGNFRPFGTDITAYPSKKYFKDTSVEVVVIEERLRIACANFPNLRATLKVDNKKSYVINSNEEDLISSYLTTTENLEWITYLNEKGPESCLIKLTWDEEPPTTQKIFSCVNLIRVHSGTHLKVLHDALRNVLMYLGKKYKYTFKPEDCFVFLRCYMNLKIVKTSFEAQVKVKLESKTDLSIMRHLGTYLKRYFEDNEEIRTDLLTRLQIYRKSLQTRKLVKLNKTRRISVTFTKLRDCKSEGGELLIGEGESAVGGLLHVRDKKKHAILPLRGVVLNVLTSSNWYENTVVKDIVQAVGTGTVKECDISKLRYNKIIIAADADPAGGWITALLITLFAKLTPDIIKNGKLYVCKTPLYGTRKRGKLIPIWTMEELNTAREKGLPIKRYKGLGEFSPADLKVFTLDTKTRQLIQVKWSENYDKIFKLMTSSAEKRKLVLGEWSIND